MANSSAGCGPMTGKHQPGPRRRIVRLEEELRTGRPFHPELVADLHEIALGQGRKVVHEEPGKLFALTCPIHPLHEPARDFTGRLAKLDEATEEEKPAAEDRLCNSFPFHDGSASGRDPWDRVGPRNR